jgi:hypothetical protein
MEDLQQGIKTTTPWNKYIIIIIMVCPDARWESGKTKKGLAVFSEHIRVFDIRYS